MIASNSSSLNFSNSNDVSNFSSSSIRAVQFQHSACVPAAVSTCLDVDVQPAPPRQPQLQRLNGGFASTASHSICHRDSQLQQLATPARQQLSTMQSAPRQLAAASAISLQAELATLSASAISLSAPAPCSSSALVFSFSAMQPQQLCLQLQQQRP